MTTAVKRGCDNAELTVQVMLMRQWKGMLLETKLDEDVLRRCGEPSCTCKSDSYNCDGTLCPKFCLHSSLERSKGIWAGAFQKPESSRMISDSETERDEITWRRTVVLPEKSRG